LNRGEKAWGGEKEKLGLGMEKNFRLVFSKTKEGRGKKRKKKPY